MIVMIIVVTIVFFFFVDISSEKIDFPKSESIFFRNSKSSGRTWNNVFSPELILNKELINNKYWNNKNDSCYKLSIDEIRSFDVRLNKNINKIFDIIVTLLLSSLRQLSFGFIVSVEFGSQFVFNVVQLNLESLHQSWNWITSWIL